MPPVAPRVPTFVEPDPGEAEKAIVALGTKALPTLLVMIQHREDKESPLKTRLMALARQYQIIRTPPDAPYDANTEALKAFQLLGANATPAVPQLVKIYEREPEAETRRWILMALWTIGARTQQAVPLLLRELANTNAWVREYAIRTLGKIPADAPEVVPALIPLLRDPEVTVRMAAVMALQNYGAEAKAAVPALLDLVRDKKVRAGSDTDFTAGFYGQPTVGSAATNALWDIDPEAARKAGMREP